MSEIQGIQSANTGEVSGAQSALSSDSINDKASDQIKLKATEETGEDERVDVDVSTMVYNKSLENDNSLPDLMKTEPNKGFVSKSELAAAREKVQATPEAATVTDSTGSVEATESE